MDTPPEQFAAYPRNNLHTYGTPEKLQALSDGYFSLVPAFVLTVICTIMSSSTRSESTSVAYLLGQLMGFGFMATIVAYFPTKKIGLDMNWSSTKVVLCSFMGGFLGLIGYGILQHIADKEIKKYGVKRGTLGFQRKDVKETIAQMKQAAAPPPYVM